jgi:transcriptional regulator with XRE-family HTH domain
MSSDRGGKGTLVAAPQHGVVRRRRVLDTRLVAANTELGDFLRSRRAALSPAEGGVATYDTARRVPGLRREEVAQLAGVSATYYARLERGESHQISDSVLDAVARALRLDETERLHLARLAWPTQLVRRDPGPERVRDSLRLMVDATTEHAVAVVGANFDLLAANRLCYALYGLPAGRPVNLALSVFLDPVMRDLYLDWWSVATGIASYLRLATSERPNDAGLATVIGELSINSPDFVSIWAAQPLTECAHHVHVFRHPQVGPITLHEEILAVPDAPGQRFVFLSAGPDEEQASRLRLLASLA